MWSSQANVKVANNVTEMSVNLPANSTEAFVAVAVSFTTNEYS